MRIEIVKMVSEHTFTTESPPLEKSNCASGEMNKLKTLSPCAGTDNTSSYVFKDQAYHQ